MIITLSTLALVAVGVFGAYVGVLQNTLDRNLRQEALLPTVGEQLMGPDGAPVLDEDGNPVTATAAPERDPAAGDALNILILGSDTRDPDLSEGRSDVILLMHVAADRQSVHVVHFPRDLFVDIPGQSRKNKINAAFASGGAPLLTQTLQGIVDVPIDHVVMLDFDSFRAVVDSIGGVDVRVEEASPGFPEGVMHMDGRQGLEFVRERVALSQGDISRGQRQQAFLRAVMLKALSSETLTNPNRLAQFVDSATTNLVTDEALTVDRAQELAFSMRSLRGSDIISITAPWTGIDMDDWAGSIVLMNEDLMADLARNLRQDTMDQYVDDSSPRQGFGG